MPETPSKKEKGADAANVIDMFTRKPVGEANSNQIIRLAPELDDIEMLYSNEANPGKMFSMKIMCWALMKDGTVDAMIPWLNKLVPSQQLNDPLNGRWDGYYDKTNNLAFFEVPSYKIIELETATTYYKSDTNNANTILQEIPDTIGTHAVLTKDHFRTIILINVTSWRLYGDGRVMAMIPDNKEAKNTPILHGDESLFPAQEHKYFHYFFHYAIANKIKHGDPEALAAFTSLIES